MDEQAAWEQRGREAREGIAALGFMVGSWRGSGTSHGAPITGELTVKTTLGDAWLEARETQFSESGEQEHEDLCLYRYDPEEHRLEVIHLMGHAHMARHPVEAVGDAFHWITGPMAPRLEICATDIGLRFEVWFPFEGAAAVTMDYTPA